MPSCSTTSRYLFPRCRTLAKFVGRGFTLRRNRTRAVADSLAAVGLHDGGLTGCFMSLKKDNWRATGVQQSTASYHGGESIVSHAYSVVRTVFRRSSGFEVALDRALYTCTALQRRRHSGLEMTTVGYDINKQLVSNAFGAASLVSWACCELPQIYHNHQLHSSRVRLVPLPLELANWLLTRPTLGAGLERPFAAHLGGRRCAQLERGCVAAPGEVSNPAQPCIPSVSWKSLMLTR